MSDQLPRMEKNILHLSKPVDYGEGKLVETLEFDEELSTETFNLLKADHKEMTNKEWLIIASRLCKKTPNFMLLKLCKEDKRLVVDYTIFLHLYAA